MPDPVAAKTVSGLTPEQEAEQEAIAKALAEKRSEISKTIVRNIEIACDNFGLLKAGFLDSKELSYSQLRALTVQQFSVSRQFAQCLAILYGRLPDVDSAAPIASHFLTVEPWGLNAPNTHSAHFRKTLEFFELNYDELRATGQTDGIRLASDTKGFLSRRLDYFLKKSPEQILGAMTFGHEYVNDRKFGRYLDLYSKAPKITKKALEYFRVHTDDEPEDYNVLKEIVIDMCVADNKGNVPMLIMQGAMEMLNLWKDYAIGIKSYLCGIT